jgi:hypothetical protein
MKKSFWISLICFATVIGCRKINDENGIGGKQAMQQDIKRFLAAKMNLMNQTRRDKVDDVIHKMDFGKMAIEGYNKKTRVVSVPVSNMDVHSFLSFLSVKASVHVNSDQPPRKTEKKRVTKVLFFVLDGELTDANIVEVSSANLSEEALDKDFVQIVKNEMPSFTGQVNVDQRTAATLKAFSGAGLTFYEGNANSLSQGFQRIDASTNAALELIRTKCNN